MFISQASPLGKDPVKGFAVYDSAFGSLRLTRQIPSCLDEILLEAARIATEEGASKIAAGIKKIIRQIKLLGQAQENIAATEIFASGVDDGWVTVVAPDQPAICHDGQSHINEEVTVLKYLYTPQGIRYSLKALREGVNWQVTAAMVHPINGVTKLERYNINTGESASL
ncbi:hypothetical protein [Nitrosospira sp. NRS527]|uniref:hypothetical protein n=1 Tax=Nitrosospira sp. NRS527 TaxID=155925 RepID=UPI001AF52319|nr:hypothetical protein [Nitrosospira sp. NRS527]BCT66583.1 hypothetical protein NNRS527_00147 [Nitrosospira sp. NRS527]